MINDTWLNEMAKSVNGESFVTPAFATVVTGTQSFAVTDTTMTGEKGARFSLTKSRASNVVNASGTRTSASVTQVTGDTLTGFGVFDTISSGTLLSQITLPSLVQTTAFDIQFDTAVSFTRA